MWAASTRQFEDNYADSTSPPLYAILKPPLCSCARAFGRGVGLYGTANRAQTPSTAPATGRHGDWLCTTFMVDLVENKTEQARC